MVRFIKNNCQDTTDLEKAIKLCFDQNITNIKIYNALDNRVDHTLYNIRLLKKYYIPNIRIRIFTNNEIIEYIKDQIIEVEGKCGDRFSVMAFTEAVVTSNCLQYNMKDYLLSFAVCESVSNSLIQPYGQIKIKGEAIIIYQDSIIINENDLENRY